jgi:hypothetical protein
MKTKPKLNRLAAWGLLAALPLLAGMCRPGPEAPQPESNELAPAITVPCKDSISLPVTEGPFLRTNYFGCKLRFGLEDARLDLWHKPYNYIINSQAEYESMIGCARLSADGGTDYKLPKIDFDQHTLLMGEMVTAVYAFPRNIKFSKVCGEYCLSLNLWPVSGAQVVSVSPYFVLVSKLPEGTKVKFNIYSKFCPNPLGDCP